MLTPLALTVLVSFGSPPVSPGPPPSSSTLPPLGSLPAVGAAPTPVTAKPPAKLAPFGYLWTYKNDAHGKTVKEVIPYEPREGDWLFFDDQSELWRKLYAIAKTAPPFHAGIVVKKPNGELAVLEAGPDDTLHVFVLDIIPRLRTFEGIIQVRRCKRELTAEQSAFLTDWANRQKGKRYAMWRLLLQGTPVKTRGGPCRDYMGHTWFERHRWLCAEIAVTGSALVGLTDPKVIRGSNTYPLDILDNSKYDLSSVYHDYGYWSPIP